MKYLPFITALLIGAVCAAYPFAAAWVWHRFFPKKPVNVAIVVLIPATLLALGILFGQLVWVQK